VAKQCIVFNTTEQVGNLLFNCVEPWRHLDACDIILSVHPYLPARLNDINLHCLVAT
jgi:hypothetical protein